MLAGSKSGRMHWYTEKETIVLRIAHNSHFYSHFYFHFYFRVLNLILYNFCPEGALKPTETMKTSTTTKKKRPTTRAGRRGMSLAEWRRQNQWPTFVSEQRSVNREIVISDKIIPSGAEPSSNHCSLFTDHSTHHSSNHCSLITNHLSDHSTHHSSNHYSLLTNHSPLLQEGSGEATIMGLHPEDAALIAYLWDASGHRGIRFSTLAALYFPEAQTRGAAEARLSYELRCCHGLTEALEQLHHPEKSSRYTCAQVRQIFLLYGSPGA